jgi:hypothetical protein
VRDNADGCTTYAIELGLLTHGVGDTIEDGLNDLAEQIVEQREILFAEPLEQLDGYAKVIRQKLESIINKV